MNTETSAEDSGASRSSFVSRRVIIFALVAIIAAASVLIVLELAFSSPRPAKYDTSFYGVSASEVVASAVQHQGAGYSQESSKPSNIPGGTGSEDWAELGDSSGLVANLSVNVFPSLNESRAYYESVVRQSLLPGYSNDSSIVQQYGKCYAFGEDVDGIGVINGICSKGNVDVAIHLVSSVDFSQIEADMTSLMGALCSAVN